ncbi:MAG: HD domain-containing protein [Planctomycetes bacterium]|nr:HD domain-containing protein [Planctomycetota bacterium]
MLRVPVHELHPGMVLARGIPFPRDPRRWLLKRDGEITADLVSRLKQLGIEEVWIRHPALEFLDDAIDDELEDHRRDLYARVRETFVRFATGSPCDLDFDRFETSIRDLFIVLNDHDRSHVLLSKLDAHDNYLLSHSANVCYLAMLLGMKTSGYISSTGLARCGSAEVTDLQHLALGCLLHDVGKMRVPLKILNKPGRLTEEEMEVVRRHPRDGYQMLKGQIPEPAADIVLNHHQRFNGQGYPSRIDAVTGEPSAPLAGEEIPIFSRIATIVDVYDAATSRRVYSRAKPPVQVLYEMRTWCEGFFDPVLEQAFYEIIPPLPIGQVVRLSDGSEAVVIDFDPRHPAQPRVQQLSYPGGESLDQHVGEEIDLAQCDGLHVHEIDGQDVRAFLASQQGELAGAGV